MKTKTKGLARIGFAAISLLLCSIPAAVPSRAANTSQASPKAGAAKESPLSVGEIVARLEEQNRARQKALVKFQGKRIYLVEYHGFFGRHSAEAVVECVYVAPKREFKVISESGSKFIVRHVIEGLLKGEEDAGKGENRARDALNTENYAFTLIGTEASSEGPQYVLSVEPKTRYKYLYRGKIWVDAKDFAVTRIEAEPARSPSFWVKHTRVQREYEKIGDFWLPAQDKSESAIRFGGTAQLSIEYEGYRITDAVPPLNTADLSANVKSRARE